MACDRGGAAGGLFVRRLGRWLRHKRQQERDRDSKQRSAPSVSIRLSTLPGCTAPPTTLRRLTDPVAFAFDSRRQRAGSATVSMETRPAMRSIVTDAARFNDRTTRATRPSPRNGNRPCRSL